jgi:hypothetical protein
MGHYDGSRIFVPGNDLDCLEVELCSDWRPEPELLKFWHPHIEARFSSPLVASENLAISGDGEWQRIAGRVARRLKPIGFVDGPRQEMQKAAALVEEAGGLAYRERNKYNDARDACTLTIAGTIGGTFNLDALIADYHDYLAVDPELATQVEKELRRLSPLYFADFFEFGDVEVVFVDHARLAGSLARCGLLLGYPIESTVALILSDYGLPGGHTRY